MGFKNVVADIGKVSLNIVDGKYLVEALTFAQKAEAVISTTIKESPVLKSVITDLVTKSEALGADAVAVVGGEGINFTTDAKALADVEAYIAWIRATLVPTIVAVYGDIKADVTAAPTASS